MARQSRWQQFANNFESTYGLVTDTARDFESARVLNKEYKDDAGNALEGPALERARNKALGDIYTKYGDVEGGLKVRTGAAQLENTQMANDIMRETKDAQIWQQGAGKSALMRERIGSANRGNRPRGGGGRVSDDDVISSVLKGAMAQVGSGGGPAPEAAPGGGVSAPPAGGGYDDPAVRPQRSAPARPTAPSGSPAAPNVPTAADQLSQVSGAQGGLQGSPAPSGPGERTAQAPSTTPPGGGISAPEGTRTAQADIPMSPTISTRGLETGYEPRPEQVEGARTAQLGVGDTMVAAARGGDQESAPKQEGGGKKGTPSEGVMTEAPTRGRPPTQENAAEVMVRGFERGQDPTKVVQKAQTVAKDRAGEFLLNASEGFLKQGRGDLAKKVVELYETHGEIRAKKILHDAETLKPSMQAALQKGGSRAGAAVIDDYNGPNRHVRKVNPRGGGVAYLEFELDDRGDPTNLRYLAQGANEQDLVEQLWGYTLDPESRVEFTANVAARNKAIDDARLAATEADVAGASAGAKVTENRATAQSAQTQAEYDRATLRGRVEQTNAGKTPLERASTRLREDPDDPIALRVVSDGLGIPPEELQASIREANDREKVKAAAGKKPGGTQSTRGSQDTSGVSEQSGLGGEAPEESQAGAGQEPNNAGLSGGAPKQSEAQSQVPEDYSERALKLYTKAVQSSRESSQVNPADRSPQAPPWINDPAFGDYLFEVMRADPKLGNLRDEGIRALVSNLWSPAR